VGQLDSTRVPPHHAATAAAASSHPLQRGRRRKQQRGPARLHSSETLPLLLLGVALPGRVRLVTWNVMAVINWGFNCKIT
jgi:hypothetical protein